MQSLQSHVLRSVNVFCGFRNPSEGSPRERHTDLLYCLDLNSQYDRMLDNRWVVDGIGFTPDSELSSASDSTTAHLAVGESLDLSEQVLSPGPSPAIESDISGPGTTSAPIGENVAFMTLAHLLPTTRVFAISYIVMHILRHRNGASNTR